MTVEGILSRGSEYAIKASENSTTNVISHINNIAPEILNDFAGGTVIAAVPALIYLAPMAFNKLNGHPSFNQKTANIIYNSVAVMALISALFLNVKSFGKAAAVAAVNIGTACLISNFARTTLLSPTPEGDSEDPSERLEVGLFPDRIKQSPSRMIRSMCITSVNLGNAVIFGQAVAHFSKDWSTPLKVTLLALSSFASLGTVIVADNILPP